jgi:Zn-dependent protease
MGWQDRPYYRDQGPTPTGPLQWLFMGSVPLFTVFGIRVRMHASMLVLIALLLITSGFQGYYAAQMAMVGCIALFTIVLLHEFGHCFAARWVGGEARDILMWPLGGLAYADAPNRPWPQLVVAAGGPMVNVLICLLVFGLDRLLWFTHSHVLLNPFTGKLGLPAISTWEMYVWVYMWWFYAISMALLFFNLLPIFPLDGGRILQALLWFRLRYYRATMITTVVGMVGSVLMVMWGITQIASWYGLMLICIGGSCLLTCYQLRAHLKTAGPWEFEDAGIDYSAAMWQPDAPKKQKKLSTRLKRKLRRQAEQEENEQAQIDRILAKVSAHGMQSLSWFERRALRKATERQRQREIEASSDR